MLFHANIRCSRKYRGLADSSPLVRSWMTISLPFYKISKSRPCLDFDSKSLVLPIVQATCTYLFFAHLEKSAQLHAGKFIPSPQKIHFWVMMLLTRIQSSVQLLQCLLLCTLLFCCCSFLLYPPPSYIHYIHLWN